MRTEQPCINDYELTVFDNSSDVNGLAKLLEQRKRAKEYIASSNRGVELGLQYKKVENERKRAEEFSNAEFGTLLCARNNARITAIVENKANGRYLLRQYSSNNRGTPAGAVFWGPPDVWGRCPLGNF